MDTKTDYIALYQNDISFYDGSVCFYTPWGEPSTHGFFQFENNLTDSDGWFVGDGSTINYAPGLVNQCLDLSVNVYNLPDSSNNITYFLPGIDASEYDNGQEYSIAFWYKAAPGDYGVRYIVSDTSVGKDFQSNIIFSFYLLSGVNADNILIAGGKAIQDPSGGQYYTNLQDLNWHLISFGVNDTSVWVNYDNGSGYKEVSLGSTPTTWSGSQIAFGYDSQSAYTWLNGFYGYLDQFRFFKGYTLTPKDINYLWNNGNGR